MCEEIRCIDALIEYEGPLRKLRRKEQGPEDELDLVLRVLQDLTGSHRIVYLSGKLGERSTNLSPIPQTHCVGSTPSLGGLHSI